MHIGKTSYSDSKKYPPGSFMGRLKERKIIATFVAFAGSGVVIIEVAHHILVNHYHLPQQIVDICIVTLVGALLGTLLWRWFRGSEKRPGNVKVEVLVVPLIILLTLVIDLKFIFLMTDISISMMLIGIVALCLGIVWVIFKSLQWAASAPEEEKKVEILKPDEEKPISFPEWKNSIAVLSFKNMSADPEQEYFCEGMAEEIINSLTHIKDLRVVARTSAFSFKGKDTYIEEIGKKLKVDKVLEGSVRKAGNRLRITAQLINVEDGYHLWSERYDRDLDDVFAIQDEVTLAIVDCMKVKLLGEEKQKLTKRSTNNPEAYQLFLKGRYFWEKRTSEGYKKAMEFYNKAIQVDPKFSLPYAGLASLYVTLGFFGLRRPKDVFPKAKSLNEKALEIDNNLAFAHRVKASISLFYDWDWPAAERSCKKAIELNPGEAFFHWIYAHYLSYMGRFDEAIRNMKKAVNLDPLSLVINCDMGHIYYDARRYDESMRWYQKTLDIEPNYSMAFYHMGINYAVRENYKEAEKSFKKAIRLTGGLPWAVGWLGYISSKLGKREKAESLLQELNNRSKKEYIHPSCFILLYLELEGIDKVFEYWNEAYEEREPVLCMIKVLPEFDPFRSDPRFDELSEKMNLK